MTLGGGGEGVSQEEADLGMTVGRTCRQDKEMGVLAELRERRSHGLRARATQRLAVPPKGPDAGFVPSTRAGRGLCQLQAALWACQL